jgi:opacity protein-like surface antigen
MAPRSLRHDDEGRRMRRIYEHFVASAVVAVAAVAVAISVVPARASAACTVTVSTVPNGNYVYGTAQDSCGRQVEVCLQNNSGLGWSSPFDCSGYSWGYAVDLNYPWKPGCSTTYYRAVAHLLTAPYTYYVGPAVHC